MNDRCANCRFFTLDHDPPGGDGWGDCGFTFPNFVVRPVTTNRSVNAANTCDLYKPAIMLEIQSRRNTYPASLQDLLK